MWHAFVTHDLAYAKVGQAYVPIFINQNVLRFQVSVDHVLAVKMHQCKNDLSAIESNIFLHKVAFFLQMEKQVTSIDVFDDQE